jgi:hypothetical protein
VTEARFDIDLEWAPPPPWCFNGQPTGRLPAGTKESTLSIETVFNASCRYDTKPGTAWEDMPGRFEAYMRRSDACAPEISGGMRHSAKVTGLEDGKAHRFFVKARDEYGHVSLNFEIRFFVGEPPRAEPFRAEIEAERGRLTEPMKAGVDGTFV